MRQIVSAAEDSANVDWEIQNLISTLGTDKIIVLVDEKDGTHPVPARLATVEIIKVPDKMRWWPGVRSWRDAEVTLGSAILASRKACSGAV
jgi:hypothetical protein